MKYKECCDWTEALQAGMAKRWGYVPKTENAMPEGATSAMDCDVSESSQSEDEDQIEEESEMSEVAGNSYTQPSRADLLSNFLDSTGHI